MTEPRVGDIVHYTPIDTEECRAAIITATGVMCGVYAGHTSHVHLTVFNALTSPGSIADVPRDPEQVWHENGEPYIPDWDRTPGTWHPVH